jgi:hypothetical protein
LLLVVVAVDITAILIGQVVAGQVGCFITALRHLRLQMETLLQLPMVWHMQSQLERVVFLDQQHNLVMVLIHPL